MGTIKPCLFGRSMCVCQGVSTHLKPPKVLLSFCFPLYQPLEEVPSTSKVFHQRLGDGQNLQATIPLFLVTCVSIARNNADVDSIYPTNGLEKNL